MGTPYRDSESTDSGMIKRTYWRKQVYRDDYGDTHENLIAANKEDGELIGSLTEGARGKMHAPALDIDFPVQTERDGISTKFQLAGTSPVLAKEWLDLQKALVDARLIGKDTAMREYEWLNEPAELGQYLAVMPPLIFDVPVVLHRSTTPGHHHLYVEVEISWRKYSKILRLMEKTGILEEGYVRSSFHRGMTLLFKPGFKNPKKGPGFFSPPHGS